MRINFERSGGFANIQLTRTFDLDKLPKDQTSALQELLERANFMSLPEQLASSAPIPDQFHYKITVDTGAERHTVVTGDRSAPESLRPLLQKLTELSRTTGNK